MSKKKEMSQNEIEIVKTEFEKLSWLIEDIANEGEALFDQLISIQRKMEKLGENL